MALLHFKPFAEQEDALSQYYLGWMYADGKGVVKDTPKALRLTKQAVKNGMWGGYAETTLGWWYFPGEHAPEIPIDYKKAFYWNTKRAEEDHPNASSNLALMYFTGHGVVQDYTQMLDHLIKSAKNWSSNFDSILEKPDEWLQYATLAPLYFMEARRLYWTSISTKLEKDLTALRQLKDREFAKTSPTTSADKSEHEFSPALHERGLA